MARVDRWYPDRITEGRFVTADVQSLIRRYEGKQVEVSIRDRRHYITRSQRGWYRGVMIPLIAHEIRSRGGQGPRGGPPTDQEVHQMLAQKFLRRSVLLDADSGEAEDVVVSTEDLSVLEMSEYIEQIMEWCHIFDREVTNDQGETETRLFTFPDPRRDHAYT